MSLSVKKNESGFTDEQLDAIEAAGSFVIVSAAAGSGKTTVMIRKIIEMLSDMDNRIRADKLIIVTFTNDAAAQIVRKLNKALSAAVSGCGADETEKKKYLLYQQSYLGAAKISTISSFCFELIRDHADELDISSDFRIIDSSEESMMLYRAFDETAEKFFSDPEKKDIISDIYSFFGWYSAQKTDKYSRYDELVSFRSFLLSIPFYKERYILPALEEYRKGNEDDFDPFGTKYGSIYARKALDILGSSSLKKAVRDILGVLKSPLGMSTDEVCGEINRIKKAAQGVDSEPAAFYRSTVPYLLVLKDFYESGTCGCSGSENWDRIAFLMRPSGDLFVRQTRTVKKNLRDIFEAAGISEHTPDDFAEMLAEFKRLITDTDGIHPCTADELREDYRSHYKRLGSLFAYMQEAESLMTELKREGNCLAFSDAELLALRLLGRLSDDGGSITKTAAAEKLSEEFERIMIDEFQDSNDLQDIIFRLLSKGGDSVKCGGNVFVVGDIKQSIYYFRHANPWLFRGYLDNSVLYSENRDSAAPRHVLLNKNFRSSRSVIDFVNYVFGKIMTKRCGGIDYDDSQKLIYSGESWENANSAEVMRLFGGAEFAPSTELLLTDAYNSEFLFEPPAAEGDAENNPGQGETAENDDPDEDTADNADNADNADDAKADVLEAANVAAKIKRMLTENKGLHPRDICILCPTNADAPFFERELAALNIRASLENRSSFLESREISVVLNFLKTIDNPHNDAAMTGVLMSPVFMFTADDMAVLALLRGRSRSIYSVMQTGIGKNAEKKDIPESSLESVTKKTADFLKMFGDLRRAASVLGIADLIRRICKDTDLISLMSMYTDGDLKRANLRLLPEYAAGYEKSVPGGAASVYGFIKYIDYMIPNKIDYLSGSAASEADDAVAIKTVHKSKGLEYPVVFLCRCHKPQRFESEDLCYTVSEGIAFTEKTPRLNYSYKTLPAEIILSAKKDYLLSERIRLLYVALTRAKNKLIISAALPLSGKKTGAVYRENAVFEAEDSIYRNIECDITQCEPDEYILKYLEGTVKPAVSPEGADPAALMRMKRNGAMINWIAAALSLSGNIPFFNFMGLSTSDDFPDVKVHMMYADIKGKYLAVSEESGTENMRRGEAVLAAAPDEDFERELESLGKYDTDERYASDIAETRTGAKVTVTDLNARLAVTDDDEADLMDRRFSESDDNIGVVYAEAAVSSANDHGDDCLRVSAITVSSDMGTKKLTAAEKGTAVHAFLQHADLRAIADKVKGERADLILKQAEILAEKKQLTDEQYGYIRNSPVIRRRIAGFFESALWKDIYSRARDEDILKEQPFMAKMSDIADFSGKNEDDPIGKRIVDYCIEHKDVYGRETFIQGIADCIIIRENDFVLVDYKTNAGKPREELIKTYEVQLLLYCRVFEKIFADKGYKGIPCIYTFGLDPVTPDSCFIGIPPGADL